MLWIKRIVGLLCVMALLVSVVHLTLMMEPFFRGSRLVRYRVVNFDLIAQTANSAGVTTIDTAALRKMTEEAVCREESSGWDAAGTLLFEGIPKKTPPPYGLLSVLMKNNGVVATYPAELENYLPSSTTAETGWYGLLEWAAQDLLSSRVVTQTWTVHDQSGQDIGQLIALWPQSNQQILGITVISPYSSPWYVEYPKNTRAADPVLRVSVLLGCLSFILLLPLWVGLDASWRGMRPWVWGLLTLVTGFIGLLAYLIARLTPPRPCPNCGEPVLAKFKRCPACGVTLLPPHCPVCRTKLRASWQQCPVCAEGRPQDQQIAASVPLTQEPKPVAAEHSAARIVVVDADLRKPVPEAQVSIEGLTLLQGRTSLQGVFDARKLQTGFYTVSAVKDGYETVQASFDAGEGALVIVEIALKPLPGGISGRVTSHDSSEAVTGARVYLDTSRIDRESVTDADGAYLLDDVPHGPYTVRVEVDGFAAQSKLVQVKQGAKVTLDFALEVDDETVAVEQMR